MNKYDFGGWATKTNIMCSDGRIIRRDAFKECDGVTVPLVWNHQHDDAMNVLGHALLENRESGVYAYCSLNDTEQGQNAKLLIQNGDITSLSIFANKLKQQGADVVHGVIREVSLVLAPANPGASIDSIICHGEGDETDQEAIIYSGEALEHSEKEDVKNEVPKKEESESKKENEMSETKEKTVKDVLDTLNEEQEAVVYALISEALQEGANTEKEDEEDEEDETGGESSMKHNVFENEHNEEYLSHAEMQTVMDEAKRYGSFRDYFAHSQDYGIENIDFLFPDARSATNEPEFIKRDMGWVDKVMGGVHHSPFSRIKSTLANITEDDARAKGYIKGKLKKNEVFALLRRTTTPTTIYKKQKLDRDDIVDITDFNVVAWLKAEMRMMLNEELARAFLLGDGRDNSSEDKINELNIRPIATDDDFYTVQAPVAEGATDDETATNFIKAVIKSRKNYKGSGNPILFTTEDMITNCLLLTDSTGRDLYTDEAQLARKLRVRELVAVPPMESAIGKNKGKLLGVLVNPIDYNVGADKGGEVNLFDDFDIDYNQQKYLIETRCSGALIKPYAAVAFELLSSTQSAESY